MSHIAVRTRRQKNWFWQDNMMIDDYLSVIGTDCYAVYNVLIRLADEFQQTCYPSYNYLQRVTGLSRNTVIKCIDKLVAVGLIIKTIRSTEESNLYTLITPPDLDDERKVELQQVISAIDEAERHERRQRRDRRARVESDVDEDTPSPSSPGEPKQDSGIKTHKNKTSSRKRSPAPQADDSPIPSVRWEVIEQHWKDTTQRVVTAKKYGFFRAGIQSLAQVGSDLGWTTEETCDRIARCYAWLRTQSFWLGKPIRPDQLVEYLQPWYNDIYLAQTDGSDDHRANGHHPETDWSAMADAYRPPTQR